MLDAAGKKRTRRYKGMIEDTINKKINEAASKAVPVLMNKLIDTIIYDAKVDGI